MKKQSKNKKIINRQSRVLREVILSQELEWERLVEDNQALQKSLQRTRSDYELPLKASEDLSADTEGKLRNAITLLANKHGIAHLIDKLYEYLVRGELLFDQGVTLELVLDDKTGVAVDAKIVLTLDASLDNLAVITSIRYFQQRYGRKPPQPQPMASNPRRLDWRPVLEWSLIHPNVTIEEIAGHLGYTAQRVRLKFSEIKIQK